jgi:hypothetical protein
MMKLERRIFAASTDETDYEGNEMALILALDISEAAQLLERADPKFAARVTSIYEQGKPKFIVVPDHEE